MAASAPLFTGARPGRSGGPAVTGAATVNLVSVVGAGEVVVAVLLKS